MESDLTSRWITPDAITEDKKDKRMLSVVKRFYKRWQLDQKKR